MSENGFDLAPCGLLRLDREFRIRSHNLYLRELSGRGEDAFEDAPPFQALLTVASRIFVQTCLMPELGLSGRVEEIALDLCRPDGERVPVLLNAVQERDAEGRLGDIRIALFRAAAKRAYEAEVPKAREAAEAASRVKADFLANVSHEIRTPLNGMIGVAAVLKATPLSSAQQDMVDIIQSSGSTLERLVSDILEVSKVEAGGLALEVRPCNLVRELDGVVDMARIRSDEKGLRFEHACDPRAEGRFLVDAVRLKQILGNLTSNAVKFTSEGFVRVEVAVVPEGDREIMVLGVQDSGIGFDEAVGDTLFQRFHQADAGITRRYGGTGLGLSISKALIDLMGGTVTVRSHPGKGTRFVVRIPVERVTAAASTAPTVAPPVAGQDGGADRPLRVLVVEDHPGNQKVVQLILGQHEVELTIADNGALGVEAWRASSFDVVLMDMQMPVMDGLTATRTIRAAEREQPLRPRTPIAVLSANAMDHHRHEALEAGADHHIAKPITPDSLISGIEATLQFAAERAAEAAAAA